MSIGDVSGVLQDALLASVLCDPSKPGLSYSELEEIGGRFGFLKGEISDVIRGLSNEHERRFVPEQHRVEIDLLWWTEPDDLRSIEAFDFVYGEINLSARTLGRGAASVPLEMLLTRAGARNLSEHDVRFVVAVLLLADKVQLKSGNVVPREAGAFSSLPSETLARNRAVSGGRPRSKWSERFHKVHAATKDVVARRNDGRPVAAEPLDAFGTLLPQLGHPGYDVWWRQMLAELRTLNPAQTPAACTVLAAALSEGALVFLCKTARERGLPLVDDETFAKGPKEWSIDALIRGAKKTTNPLFDDATARRAERLKMLRQRIHAGRFLAQNATPGSLDMRPDEARESLESLDIIVRAILDWLGRTRRA